MITVVDIKAIKKYLVFALILVVIGVSTRYFNNLNGSSIQKDMLDKLGKYSFVGCIEETLPDIEGKNADKVRQIAVTNRASTSRRILSKQLPMLEVFSDEIIDEDDEEINDSEKDEQLENAMVANEENNEQQDNVNKAETGVHTEEIKENNIESKFTNTYGSVKVKNQTKYELTEEILTPNFELSNKNDIIIFHTHTCESYTPDEKYNYTMTGSYRTTDLNYSVAKVGDELEKQLTSYGYKVTHDKTYHDYPAYSGSYNRSFETVRNILNSQNSTQMVIDLHRDAIGSNNNYAPSVKIGEETVAQLMFVIGTNGGGLEHPNWQQNLKFAVKVQEKANELYPGLFKPIVLRDSRYNQQLASAATIIEVGATGNNLEQCLLSMKYLSKVISEVVK